MLANIPNGNFASLGQPAFIVENGLDKPIWEAFDD